MTMPINHFKRAIAAGQLQLGLWSGLSNNITVEVLANSGFDWLLLDTEHSPNELPMVHSQLQAISQRQGASDRAPAVERHRHHQALPRRRRADAADPVHPGCAGSAQRSRRDPLSAARRARLLGRGARIRLRPRQGLSEALRGAAVRAAADGNAAGAGQHRSDRRGRRRRRHLHRPRRPVGLDGLHRPADASGSGGGDRRRHRAASAPAARRPASWSATRRWRATTSTSAAPSSPSAATSASWRAAPKRSRPNSAAA